MKSESWGKEPFDLRLTLLRMVRCLPWILTAILAGTLLLGGGYYLKNVALRGERSYGAEATFLVEYADENWAQNLKYVNENSWNLWLEADVFREFLPKYLANDSLAGVLSSGNPGAVILKATVPSDLRVVQITAISGEEKNAERVLGAVVSAMENDFPGVMEDIAAIRVTDRKPAREIRPDVRPLRAFVLAAVISAFFVILWFWVRELTLERIWLPTSLTNLYGLRNLGRLGSKEFETNLQYFLQEKHKIGVCLAGKNTKKDSEDDVKSQKEELDAILRELAKAKGAGNYQFMALPCTAEAPENAGALRKAEGVLLAVRSGEDAKHLEYLLDFLGQQDVEVTAAFLWKEDAWLVRTYYRL